MRVRGLRLGHSKPRLRPRLGRTLSRARWPEYEQLLGIALNQEYEFLGVEQWLASSPQTVQRPLVVLRHDVDQYPGSALRMASIESEFGVRSTWYFRWRTADPAVVEGLRGEGHAVGLHYETLTRLALERGLSSAETSALIPEARELLAQEIAAFGELCGPIRSACPHGDTRVAGVHNGVLLRGQDLAAYGIEWDTNDAVGQRGVDVWLTDRSSAEGRWQDRSDPLDLLIDRRTPLLLIVHPNNWAFGPALWWDRLVPGGTRTRGDEPPITRGSPDDPGDDAWQARDAERAREAVMPQSEAVTLRPNGTGETATTGLGASGKR
jgi:hypothetical protein